jgi:hypothetical protein
MSLMRKTIEAIRERLAGNALSDEQKEARLIAREAALAAEVEEVRKTRERMLKNLDRAREALAEHRAEVAARIADKSRPGA